MASAGRGRAGPAPPHQIAAAAVRVGIVVLNWNDAARTIQCVESVLAASYDHRFVIIVDNGSTDGSVAEIGQWLSSRGEPHRVCAASESVAISAASLPVVSGRPEPVWILETEANLGYGAGNNAGIRLAMGRGADAMWILNNDTVVDRDSLGRLVDSLRSGERVGLVGSCLVEYGSGGRVQCLGGGTYNPWTSRTTLVGAGRTWPVVQHAEDRVDFISGAAILLSAACLREIGGFEEGYFLYCEEIDLARRAKAAGWESRVVVSSVVQHEHGAALGSSADRGHRSTRSFYYASRAAVLLSRKHRRLALPSVILARVALAISLALQGRGDASQAVLRGVSSAITVRSWSRVPPFADLSSPRA